jgi:hypothetical protein
MQAQSMDDDEFALLEAQAALVGPGADERCGADVEAEPPPNGELPGAGPVIAARTFLGRLRPRRLAVSPAFGWIGAATLLVAATMSIFKMGTTRHNGIDETPALGRLSAGRQVDRAPLALRPAQLSGAVGARWAGEKLELPEGEPLYAGQRLELIEGLAEVCFQHGARVVVQGPAILEIQDARTASVFVGRVAANVPPAAGRFTVRTSVADLAGHDMEFGVDVDVDGSLATQVYSGELKLASRRPGKATRMQLAGGQGLRVDATSGRVGVLKQPHALRFVRYLPHHDMPINLADVVAGGDGLRSSHEAYHQGVDMEGEAVSAYGAPAIGDGRFHVSRGFELIDGVFIPDGKHKAVQIDSIGRTCTEFPPTAGDCWGGVIMARRPKEERSLPFIRLEFHGNNYGYVNWLHIASRPEELSPEGRGLIGMHSNSGITFDLHAFRARHPHKSLVRFRALVGNLEAKAERYQADAWVFVDGKRRYHRGGFSREDGPEAIDVPLSDSDRFLVLAVTDAGGSTAYDWVAFGDPVIEMTIVDRITAAARPVTPVANGSAFGRVLMHDPELRSRPDPARASLAGGL